MRHIPKGPSEANKDKCAQLKGIHHHLKLLSKLQESLYFKCTSWMYRHVLCDLLYDETCCCLFGSKYVYKEEENLWEAETFAVFLENIFQPPLRNLRKWRCHCKYIDVHEDYQAIVKSNEKSTTWDQIHEKLSVRSINHKLLLRGQVRERPVRRRLQTYALIRKLKQVPDAPCSDET